MRKRVFATALTGGLLAVVGVAQAQRTPVQPVKAAAEQAPMTRTLPAVHWDQAPERAGGPPSRAACSFYNSDYGGNSVHLGENYKVLMDIGGSAATGDGSPGCGGSYNFLIGDLLPVFFDGTYFDPANCTAGDYTFEMFIECAHLGDHNGCAHGLGGTVLWTSAPQTFAQLCNGGLNYYEPAVNIPGGLCVSGPVYVGLTSIGYTGTGQWPRLLVNTSSMPNPVPLNRQYKTTGQGVNPLVDFTDGWIEVGIVGNESDACAAADGACPVATAPANDECATASVAVNGPNFFTNVAATLSGPDIDAACSAYNNMPADVWFTYQSTCTGFLNVDTCASDNHADTILALYDSGTCPTDASTLHACSDDSCVYNSEIILAPVVAGNDYIIRIAGWGGEEGCGTLSIECLEPCTVDADCATGGSFCDGVGVCNQGTGLCEIVEACENWQDCVMDPDLPSPSDCCYFAGPCTDPVCSGIVFGYDPNCAIDWNYDWAYVPGDGMWCAYVASVLCAPLCDDIPQTTGSCIDPPACTSWLAGDQTTTSFGPRGFIRVADGIELEAPGGGPAGHQLISYRIKVSSRGLISLTCGGVSGGTECSDDADCVGIENELCENPPENYYGFSTELWSVNPDGSCAPLAAIAGTACTGFTGLRGETGVDAGDLHTCAPNGGSPTAVVLPRGDASMCDIDFYMILLPDDNTTIGASLAVEEQRIGGTGPDSVYGQSVWFEEDPFDSGVWGAIAFGVITDFAEADVCTQFAQGACCTIIDFAGDCTADMLLADCEALAGFSSWQALQDCTACPTPGYCDSTWLTTYDWISNVTLSDINNNSGPDAGGYGDYTAQSTDLKIGATNQLSVTVDNQGFLSNVVAWIDWNHDFTWDVPDETYDLGTTPLNGGTLTIDISVPAGAPMGATTMRVIEADTLGPAPGSCSSGQFGETEDYTVNVVTVICGDGELDSGETCDDGNTADGDCCSSTCQLDAIDTACGDPTDTECNPADTCDGAGVCRTPILAAGDPCGDATDTECNGADTCDGGDNCLSNLTASGTPCGSAADTECTDPDTCSAGDCLSNNAADGDPCGRPAEACHIQDTCLGGSCEAADYFACGPTDGCCPPGCGPRDHDLDCGDPVPTVSTWGLVILAMLLLVAMKVHFGRRRSVA